MDLYTPEGLHRFSIQIPKALMEIRLQPSKFMAVLNHCVKGQDLSIDQWCYFIKKGVAEEVGEFNERNCRIKDEYRCEVIE